LKLTHHQKLSKEFQFSIASSNRPTACKLCSAASCAVTRHLFEKERQYVKALRGTEAFERSARERKKVEILFAHLKRNLGLRRLRLRGLTGAKDELLLAATVQNLKKLVRLCANGPPMTAKSAV
jgi:Transposase DDE domain